MSYYPVGLWRDSADFLYRLRVGPPDCLKHQHYPVFQGDSPYVVCLHCNAAIAFYAPAAPEWGWDEPECVPCEGEEAM